MANELVPIDDSFDVTLDDLDQINKDQDQALGFNIEDQNNFDDSFDVTLDDLDQINQDIAELSDTSFDENELNDIYDITPDDIYGPSQTPQQYKKDSSIITKLAKSATRGFGKGVTGLIIGTPEDKEQADTFAEYLAEFGGELASDAPAYSGGAALGAIIGGTIGSIVPVIGTATGAMLGGAFMTMALPTMIKKSFDEYKDYAKQGGDATFEGFISRTGNILGEGAKSGAVGLVTANMGRFLPLLKKVPIWNRVLNTRAGQKATYKGLEYLGINAAQSLIEGQLPTKEQWRDNALAMAAMGIAHKFGAPIKKYLPEPIKKAPSRFIEKLPAPIRKPIQRIQGYAQEIKQSVQNKQAFDLLKEHVGERDAKIFETQLEFRDKIFKKEKGKMVPRFTKTQLEEASYLRQKTGNPNIVGDTYEKLKERASPKINKLVKDVDLYLKKRLKQINDDPRLKNINPRDVLVDTYLPGLYEGDIKKAVQTPGFPELTPFSGQKQFLTHAEAIKAGLTPKYKGIVDSVAIYDEITNRALAKSKMVDAIENKVGLEKKSGDMPLIVRSNNKELYTKAKDLGYISFGDNVLKRYKNSAGEWKTSMSPVLVDPQIADAFQGVFSKEGFKQDNPFWRNYDNAANILRTFRVQLSPFHAVALTESSIGALGFTKALNFKWIAENGDKLLDSKQFMKDAVRDGVKFEKPIEYKKGSNYIDRALDYVGSKTGRVGTAATGKLKKATNYLFDTYHPRLKAVTYNELLNKELIKLIKEGRPATEQQRRQIGRDVASFVNNIYGGQNWETAKFFNNPNTMKWMRRFIAYPDWTISALKQAGSAISSGQTGKMGRKYWMNYMIKTSLVQASLKYLFGGLEQTDKKNNSVKGIKWSRDKAIKNFWDGDPSKWYMFSLPDVNVKLGPITFNPGRDSKDRKTYGHFGKQALEVLGYGTKPVQTLFGKSNPILQLAYQQLIGATPAGDTQFPVRGKYDEGEFKPWDASEPYTKERVVSRVKALMQGVLPFSVSSLTSRGFGPYVGSLLGAFPVSRGMNLHSAEKYIARALKRKDSKLLANTIKALIDNGYKDSSINGLITKISRRIYKR